MAKAIVRVPFKGCIDGEMKPRRFNVGDVVEGQLGDVAIREGWAAPGEKKTPANKAMKPKETRGVSSQADPVLQKRTAKKSKRRVFKQ